MNWSRWPNFSEREFQCSHTGICNMHPDFMDRLQALRTAYGKPMQVSSGYRSKYHPIEAAKEGGPGPHNTGRAVDIVCSRIDAYNLLKLAFEFGFTGIGIQQKGERRFLHLDDLPAEPGRPRPTLWSY